MFPSEHYPGDEETDILAVCDPRANIAGARVYCPETTFESETGLE